MSDQRPVIVVTGKRRPHELMLLAFSLVVGLLYLTGALDQPASVSSKATWVNAWAAGLALSGAVGLIGCYWQGDLVRSLTLEQAGMLFGAAAALTYTSAAFSYAGTNALFPSGFCLAWAVANVARAVQIGKDLRTARKGGS